MNAAPPAEPHLPVRAFVEPVMGMPISIHVRAPDPRSDVVAGAVAATYATLRDVDRVLSPWRPDSHLLRVRRGELDPAQAHPWLAEIARLCRRVEEETFGLFTSVLLGPDGTAGFDPTGLAKAWAVELASAYLHALPQVTFCINAGGDLLCGNGTGAPTVDNTWRVGIEDPNRPGQLARVVEVSQGAVATSGSAARGAHIIDPRTGELVCRPGSATVTGPSLLRCDIWATVAYIDPDITRQALTGHPDYHLNVLS